MVEIKSMIIPLLDAQTYYYSSQEEKYSFAKLYSDLYDISLQESYMIADSSYNKNFYKLKRKLEKFKRVFCINDLCIFKSTNLLYVEYNYEYLSGRREKSQSKSIEKKIGKIVKRFDRSMAKGLKNKIIMVGKMLEVLPV